MSRMFPIQLPYVMISRSTEAENLESVCNFDDETAWLDERCAWLISRYTNRHIAFPRVLRGFGDREACILDLGPAAR